MFFLNQKIVFLLLLTAGLSASDASVRLVPKVNFKDKEKISSTSCLFEYFCKRLHQIHIKYPHLAVPVLKNKSRTERAEWVECLRKIKQLRDENKIISEHIVVYKTSTLIPKNLYCLMIHVSI